MITMAINRLSNRKSNESSLKYHNVKPHYVGAYIKKDGTFVRGHLRDGDGNSATYNPDGYYALNPGQKALIKTKK